MDWNVDSHVSEILGEGGPWARLITEAWQAATGHGLRHLPPDPSPPFGWTGELEFDAQVHARLISFWNPLVHLVGYGLGWAYPDQGLARWYVSRGRVNDPLLRVLSEWWGRRRIADFLLWGGFAHGLPNAAPLLNPPVSWSDVELRNRKNAADWQYVWGGGSDPMHLMFPSQVPANAEKSTYLVRTAPQIVNGELTGRTRVVMARERYAGWYTELDSIGGDLIAQGQRPHIDVYIDSVGFLGTYRKHPDTLRWFRGRSDIHLWGN